MADRQAQRFARVSEIALGLPEVRAETSGREHSHTTFLVRKQKIAWHLVDHHGDGRVALQTRAAPGENRALIDADPDAYVWPKYMGHHGWVGYWLDRPKVDWDIVESLLVASYRIQAPKTLVKLLDQ
jgi:hypothetical protein